METINYYVSHASIGTLLGGIGGKIWGGYLEDTTTYMYSFAAAGLLIALAFAYLTKSSPLRYKAMWILSILAFAFALFTFFWIDMNSDAILYFMICVGLIPFIYEAGRYDTPAKK